MLMKSIIETYPYKEATIQTASLQTAVFGNKDPHQLMRLTTFATRNE